MNGNILLIGFMGTGKSTVSHELHHITGMEEIDLDAFIVEKAGCSINEIFEQQGEEAFRELETASLKEVMKKSKIILSCGGGTVIRSENVSCMKQNGKIVLLTAEPQTILDRVKNNTDRPLLNGNMNIEYIEKLLEKRKDLYFQAADIIISTDGKNVMDICREILNKIGRASNKMGKIDVCVKNG